MTLHLKHKFASAKSDGADPTLVQPSNWNDEHTLSTAASKLVGSDSSGPAAVQELPGEFTPDGDFTLVNAQEFFRGARGATGSRPVSPLEAMERWNTTTTKKEVYDGTDWQNLATEEFVTDAIAAIPLTAGIFGYIGGLTYQVGGVNTLSMRAGSCVSDDGTDSIVMAATNKRVDVAWVVDSGGTTGSLDTGAAANSAYYIFAIKNPSTGATATLTSLSSTAPTMPAGYTKKRLTGWFRRSGGDIVAFHTYELSGGGISYEWDLPTLDFSLAGVSNSRSLITLGSPVQVPLALSIEVVMGVQADFISGDAKAINICSPNQSDAAVNFGSAVLGAIGFTQSVTLNGGAQFVQSNTGSIVWQHKVRPNLSAQVAARASGAGAVISGSVIKFEWSRR